MPFKSFKPLLGIMLWTLYTVSFAQDPLNPTILHLYQAAERYDASLSAVKLAFQAAKEKTIQAQAVLKPTANMGLNASANYANLINTPITTHSYVTAAAILSANYPLWRPSLQEINNQAQIGLMIAHANLANVQQELILRVAQAYFDVLLAQDNISNIVTQKLAITQQLKQAKHEFELGTKTIVDTNESQSRYDAILAQEVVATGELLSKKSALSLLTGLKIDTVSPINQTIAIDLPQPNDPLLWINRAEQAAISVQIAQLTADIAQSEVKRNQLNKKMTVDLSATLAYNRAIRSIAANTNSNTVLANIGIQANYPIYSAGILDSKSRESALNYEKSLMDVEATRRNIAQATRQTYLALTYGIAQIKALQSAIQSSKTLLDSTKLGYSVGVRINLDVLNAQQLLALNQTQLAKARYDTLILGLRLKALTAQLTVEDLNGLAVQFSTSP